MKKRRLLIATSVLSFVFLIFFLASAVETTQPSITVLSPNGGEIWQIGTTQTIKWNSDLVSIPEQPIIFDISLAPYCSPGQTCVALAPFVIAKSVSGSNYNWNVGSVIGVSAPVGSYTMKICRSGTATCDSSDSYFKITSTSAGNNPPRIIGIPAIPSNIQPGQSVKFSWSATDADNDDLSWSVDWDDNSGEAGACSTTRRKTGTGWSYSVSRAWAQAGTYQVKVTVSDCVGGSDSSSFAVQVGSARPSITVLSPNGGESWQKGTTQTIKWRDNGPIVACEINASTGVTTCPPPKLYDIKLVGTEPSSGTVVLPGFIDATIAKSVSGSSYSWGVGKIMGSDGLVPNGSYTVRVCQSGTTTCDSSDSYFKITSSLKCEDYSYNECPSGCSKINPPCLPCPVSSNNGTEPSPVCPSCRAPYCATPGQKEVYLNQKFELKPQESVKVIDYKNMEIKSLGILCASCPENGPCPPNPCKLHLQVSMSSIGIICPEIAGPVCDSGSKIETYIGTDGCKKAKCVPIQSTTTSTSSAGSTSTTNTGVGGSGGGGTGIGTVFDIGLGEKKEVFGASISLLRLEKDVAVLVVEEQIIIKPVCGNGICEAGEGEICVAPALASPISCEEGKECKTPQSACYITCPQDCGKVKEPIYIELNDKFKLQISQAAILKSENIKVTFKNMIASKCKEEIVSSKASSIAIKEKIEEAERTLTGSVVTDIDTEKPSIPVLKCIGSGPKALLSYEIEREKGNPIKKGVLELDLKEKKQIGDFTVAFLDYDYASRTGVFLIDKEKFECPEKCKCDSDGNTIECPVKRTCEEGKILCPDGECRDKCEIKPIEDCKYGCNYEGSCFPMGVRSKGLYCGNDLVMSSQKNSDQICENDFECSTNVCVSGKCVSKSLINKILDFFKRLFGAG